MFKLPVCPHCKVAYSYKEITFIKQGIHICYHCNKKFRVIKYRGQFLLMLIVCTLLVAVNVFMLFNNDNINLAVLAIANASVVTAAILMFPLMVIFKAEKITKSEKKELRKNKTGKNNK